MQNIAVIADMFILIVIAFYAHFAEKNERLGLVF